MERCLWVRCWAGCCSFSDTGCLCWQIPTVWCAFFWWVERISGPNLGCGAGRSAPLFLPRGGGEGMEGEEGPFGEGPGCEVWLFFFLANFLWDLFDLRCWAGCCSCSDPGVTFLGGPDSVVCLFQGVFFAPFLYGWRCWAGGCSFPGPGGGEGGIFGRYRL